MKVSELVPGAIYTPEKKTVTKDSQHTILGVRHGNQPVIKVKERCIWRGFNEANVPNPQVYMYLGFTMDEWSINDIYKHHWFLVNGEEIVVNNYSLKLLRKIKHESKL